nr:hypothetical protein [Trentepohlia sp. YN1317]
MNTHRKKIENYKENEQIKTKKLKTFAYNIFQNSPRQLPMELSKKEFNHQEIIKKKTTIKIKLIQGSVLSLNLFIPFTLEEKNMRQGFALSASILHSHLHANASEIRRGFFRLFFRKAGKIDGSPIELLAIQSESPAKNHGSMAKPGGEPQPKNFFSIYFRIKRYINQKFFDTKVYQISSSLGNSNSFFPPKKNS